MKRTVIILTAVATMMFGLGMGNSVYAQHPDVGQYKVVDKNPEYPGGLEAMYQFIAANLQYPELAKENNIQGRVYISFVVEKDGTLSDYKIVHDIGGGCAAAAIEVVKKMPKWKPGEVEGKPVRVQYNLPVSFKLTDPEIDKQ